ncbi:bifunctional arginine demethylase and lysyl-hydroxylase psr-1 [Uranotaenia lowii]|uniref:bifunctional arginine demethylase and lysyl-hydroxylase psr-1 n=1 Tax=Uranotaenia lowii TaxID=190385 RepID=UPI00247AACAC|nr:bifunctional arginine demethylase and lysyl-hydroxylase psr-1 [Uranotaenia lowii]
MEEVDKKLKNFIINSYASGVELSCLPSLGKLGQRSFGSSSSSGGSFLDFRFLSFLQRWRPDGMRKHQLVLVFLICAIGKHYLNELFADEDCIVGMPQQLQKAFRPPESSCEFCSHVVTDAVPRLANVDPDEFERKFAYSGGPVIVTDATANWTAVERFDYWYFKDVYQRYGRRRKAARCQFFPYRTGFRSIWEALSLDEARVNYAAGTEPWYFGWSNCDPEIVRELRQHYGRPYFLPKASENNAVDWVFMGGTGLGAHMHVDNVRLPSWQSQLKGSKEWILAPPPECYYSCNFLSVVVKTGETIVLDTNRWYHKTNVLSGELSITVGAEYD